MLNYIILTYSPLCHCPSSYSNPTYPLCRSFFILRSLFPMLPLNIRIPLTCSIFFCKPSSSNCPSQITLFKPSSTNHLQIAFLKSSYPNSMSSFYSAMEGILVGYRSLIQILRRKSKPIPLQFYSHDERCSGWERISDPNLSPKIYGYIISNERCSGW
jgi:hypothetical protein